MALTFLILGAPRTGSTLVAKTLDSIDGIRCHGELLAINAVRGFQDGFDPQSANAQQRQVRLEALRRERDADPALFIRRALAQGPPVRGFKALYGSLEHPPFAAAFTALLTDPETRVIHLLRTNALRRYISEQLMLAGIRNNSLAGSNTELQPITIDIQAFEQHRTLIDAQVQRCRDSLTGHPVMEVTYETLAAAPEQAIARICSFLDVAIAASSVVPALSKVGAEDLAETVGNIDELRSHPATRAFVAMQ